MWHGAAARPHAAAVPAAAPVTVKAIVVGDGGVGKTSLTTRYARGRYTDNYKKTIGAEAGWEAQRLVPGRHAHRRTRPPRRRLYGALAGA